MNINNPLQITFFIYLFIIIYIFYYRPNIVFQNEKINIPLFGSINRLNMVLLLAPIILYILLILFN